MRSGNPGEDMSSNHRPIKELADRLDQSWPNIEAAEEATQSHLSELKEVIEPAVTDDVSFVVFGSAARREITAGSDLDWTLLVDGLSDPAHFDTVLDVEARLADARFKAPGSERTFGGMAFAHELLHRIGGADDTNRNTTQRILLLLESRAIGNDIAYSRVVKNVLMRYISEDWGWVHGKGPAKVPRFLQNDLARYWRTVAVDFAYKRRDRGGRGWALRTVKLRMSRKMTYAAGLLACFSCELEDVLEQVQTQDEESEQLVVGHLYDRFSQPPLDIVAKAVLAASELEEPASALFSAYDDFLGLIGDEEKRKHLDNLPPDASDSDEVYGEAREVSHRFQKGLDGIFFGEHEELAELTKIYGVF